MTRRQKINYFLCRDPLGQFTLPAVVGLALVLLEWLR